MIKHRETHPVDVPGCYGCKLASLGLRAVDPGNKETIDHTDTAVVKTTEHFKEDRQDVHVKMNESVSMAHREGKWLHAHEVN